MRKQLLLSVQSHEVPEADCDKGLCHLLPPW
jgi:hypothetical protein